MSSEGHRRLLLVLFIILMLHPAGLLISLAHGVITIPIESRSNSMMIGLAILAFLQLAITVAVFYPRKSLQFRLLAGSLIIPVLLMWWAFGQRSNSELASIPVSALLKDLVGLYSLLGVLIGLVYVGLWVYRGYAPRTAKPGDQTER